MNLLSRLSSRAARRATALVAAFAAVICGAGVAWAYWSTNASGVGSATTATLNAPTEVRGDQTPGTGTVMVSWAAPSGLPSPVGYYVERSGSSGNVAAACGTSAASTTPSLTCNDTSVPLGSYTYTVVAVLRSWTATSSSSPVVVVGKSAQSIKFTSAAPTGAAVNGTAYEVSAAGGGSGNPVTFTSATPGVCTLSGTTVSFVHAGTCTINADQAGSAYYDAAPTAQQTFTVAKGSQTIKFTSTVPTAAVVGGPGYTPTAIGGTSGNAVVFTIDATTTSTCSTSSGGVVTYQHVGTCTVDANQDGTSDYSAASQVQQSYAVGKGAQAITFTSTPPANAKVNGATYTVGATGGASGNPVTFSIDAASSGVCSISGPVVSFTGSGTCIVDANQAGSSDYLPAGQIQQQISVTKTDQAITFTSAAPTNATVGGATYTPVANSTSGLGVSFTIDSATTNSACSINSSGVVSFAAVGQCVIDADQAGNATYNSAPRVQQSFAVSASSISVTSLQLANAPGKTPGKLDSGDTVTIGFSAGLAVNTICSAWSGNGSNQTNSTADVVVSGSGTGGSNNVLSLASWTACQSYHVGSIDLGSNGYVTSTGSSSKAIDFLSSTVAYSATAHTLTITFGTPTTGGNVGTLGTVPSSVATLTTDAALRGAAGQTIASPFATGNVQQF